MVLDIAFLFNGKKPTFWYIERRQDVTFCFENHVTNLDYFMELFQFIAGFLQY